MNQYRFIFMFGMGSQFQGSSNQHAVVEYGTRGYYMDLYDTLSNIYRRGRVVGRTRRLMAEITKTIAQGKLPVVVANSHGCVVTANAVRALANSGYPHLHKVSVYALAPPRMVPWMTPSYKLRDSVNVIHIYDHLIPYIRKLGWWDPRALQSEPDRLMAFKRNKKIYKLFITQADPGTCTDVHVCLHLLRAVMHPDMIPGFTAALSALRGSY